MYGCVSIGIPHVFSVILFSIKCSKVPSSESSESSESSTLPFGQVRGVKGEPDGNGPAESRKPPTPPAVPNASDREHTVLPDVHDRNDLGQDVAKVAAAVAVRVNDITSADTGRGRGHRLTSALHAHPLCGA